MIPHYDFAANARARDRGTERCFLPGTKAPPAARRPPVVTGHVGVVTDHVGAVTGHVVVVIGHVGVVIGHVGVVTGHVAIVCLRSAAAAAPADRPRVY